MQYQLFKDGKKWIDVQLWEENHAIMQYTYMVMLPGRAMGFEGILLGSSNRRDGDAGPTASRWRRRADSVAMATPGQQRRDEDAEPGPTASRSAGPTASRWWVVGPTGSRRRRRADSVAISRADSVANASPGRQRRDGDTGATESQSRRRADSIAMMTPR